MNQPRQFLHTANRMEDLTAMLAGVLRQGSGDPFAEETVLVQSRGMGRWVSLQLADKLGICLNVRFPFPREVVEEVLAGLLPEWTKARALRRETMVWKIFRLLDEFRGDEDFHAIVQYLEGGDLLKRIQLADRLANLFDQYLMYRPEWLTRWERDPQTGDWQAILWSRLVQESEGEFHLGHAWKALRRREIPQPVDLNSLPPRLCVFGVSSLPPLFLEILQGYACHGDLHLFLLQPTDQYWGDLVSKKKKARLAKKESGACYLEEGHPLVASLGRQGQDLLNLLIDADFQQSDERESFREAGSGSLLGQLQTDILRLIDRETPGSTRIEMNEDDGSIRVHSCHGPMREVEVLHDQLLDLFQKDSTLRARDVLVMIPDIESYAPYIQAVFGAGEGPGGKIPFSVVDRRPRSAHHAIDVWFRLLELAGGRFGARDVVSLLESPPFRIRFGMTDRDVNTLRNWIQWTGIRWGVDAAHRGGQGLPSLAETTWQNGIDQWLLGFAMREQHEGEVNSFRQLFAFDEIEGGNIELLNRFLAVLDFLFRTRALLEKPRSGVAWCQTLLDLLDDLFGNVEEVAREADAIRASLSGLRETIGAALTDEALPLEVLCYVLEKTIEESVPSGGFLSGGVTICALQPMRTIPARVVCLLGMNDNDYPRRPRQLGFDRMRHDRRVGDRSVREDDRYLFLETILSVRETLMISYVGQSARDLSEAPPSVLVSELLDHLDRVCQFPDGRSAREILVRRHRLQPFHPDYFGPGPLFSYSSENAVACQRLMGEASVPPPFVRDSLLEPEAEWRTIGIRQLVAFFRNPSEYFIKERLGLRFPRDEEMLEDSEIFEVKPLEKYPIKKEAVEGIMDQREPHEWERLQARGRAPLGTPGLAACRAIGHDAQKFAVRLKGVVDPAAPKSNRSVDLSIGLFHLRGEIGPFFGDDLVIFRPAKVKAKDRIAAWIQHLVACASATAGGEVKLSKTLLIGEDAMLQLSPREDALELLESLLKCYWRGLREPLPFFPEVAWTYLEVLEKKQDPGVAKEAAWGRFIGPSTDYVTCEMDDYSVALCWGNGREEDAIGDDFEAIASTVFIAFEALAGNGGKG